MVEITEAEMNKEKMIKKKWGQSHFWDNIKHPNIQIIDIREEEDKRKGDERIFEIIVEKFPEMGEEITAQVQEFQRVL